MLDYDIIKVFRPLIIDGLLEFGINAKVLMNYQPTKQKLNDNTVYFFPISSKNVGYQAKYNEWDDTLKIMRSVEKQAKETTFQVNGVLKQNPSDLTITAMDLTAYVNMILQRRETISTLKENGIGILRVGELRNVTFQNSDENWEYNPSFDFIITHEAVIRGEMSKIDNFNLNIKRI